MLKALLVGLVDQRVNAHQPEVVAVRIPWHVLGVGLKQIALLPPPVTLQIYDLSVDALSPTFYFLLPSSKIRDVTFLFNEEGKNIIVIMSSAGYMYTQLMEEASSAQQGPFYVTNVLEINHEDLKVRVTFFCSVFTMLRNSSVVPFGFLTLPCMCTNAYALHFFLLHGKTKPLRQLGCKILASQLLSPELICLSIMLCVWCLLACTLVRCAHESSTGGQKRGSDLLE